MQRPEYMALSLQVSANTSLSNAGHTVAREAYTECRPCHLQHVVCFAFCKQQTVHNQELD